MIGETIKLVFVLVIAAILFYYLFNHKDPPDNYGAG